MNILICNEWSPQPWVWPFRNGFKKLGHDVRWIGFGGTNLNDALLLGLSNDWEQARERYSESEYRQYQGEYKWRLDIPLADYGLAVDGEKCFYSWAVVETELSRWADEWLPDLILIFEQSFKFIGERTARFRGIPVGLIISDNRGSDLHYRIMQYSGADFCTVNNSYYWDIYKEKGMNPIGVIPQCVDTDIFKHYEEESIDCDVYYSGNTGLNLQAEGRTDYRTWVAYWTDPNLIESMYRAEFLRELLLTRQFNCKLDGIIESPVDWAKAMCRANINFNPSGAVYPSKHAINQRLFVAPACGRLLVTSWDWDLHRYYKDGEEIIAFRENSHPRHHEFKWIEAQVVKDKIAYYLAHDKEREEIAANGLRATRERHECKVRAQELLDVIKDAEYI